MKTCNAKRHAKEGENGCGKRCKQYENGASMGNDAKAWIMMQASDMQKRKRKWVLGENHRKAHKVRCKIKTGGRQRAQVLQHASETMKHGKRRMKPNRHFKNQVQPTASVGRSYNCVQCWMQGQRRPTPTGGKQHAILEKSMLSKCMHAMQVQHGNGRYAGHARQAR